MLLFPLYHTSKTRNSQLLIYVFAVFTQILNLNIFIHAFSDFEVRKCMNE